MNRSSLTRSFLYAIQGIVACIRTERNMRIHCTAAAAAAASGIYFHITREEWLVLLLTIGGVISLELVNTAVEKAVDLVTEKPHPLAKFAKDAASGAVLVFACLSVVIGILIFAPYIRT